MSPVLILLPIFLTISGFLSASAAKHGQTAFFGSIQSLGDCEKFNNAPEAQIAKALVSFSRNRTTWRIHGPAPTDKFPVEECYAKLTDSKKTIIFHVSKDFEKLKTFPSGPGWLQVNVAKGPNALSDPDHVPAALEDDAFMGILFGFSESETGPEQKYSKEQIDKLVKQYETIEAITDRFFRLNSRLAMNSVPETFRSISNQNTGSVFVYQEKPSVADSRIITEHLGSSVDINFLFEVGMTAYFESEEVTPTETTECITEAPEMTTTTPKAKDVSGGAPEMISFSFIFVAIAEILSFCL